MHPFPYLVHSSLGCISQGSAVFGDSCFPLPVRSRCNLLAPGDVFLGQIWQPRLCRFAGGAAGVWKERMTGRVLENGRK